MSKVPVIDGHMLDTDNRFFDYCNTFGITNPFNEEQERFQERCTYNIDDYGHTITHIRPENPIEAAWRQEHREKKDKYLRLSHTFRLWDFHFWMDWPRFKKHLEWSTDFADTSIYLPCDCAERQCNMACTYFGTECPRMKEELRAPEILGFEGRWEYHDNYD